MKSGEKINERLRRLEASVSKGLRDYYMNDNTDELQKVEGNMYVRTPKVIAELVVSEVSSARENDKPFASGHEACAFAVEWLEEVKLYADDLGDDLREIWVETTDFGSDAASAGSWSNLLKDAQQTAVNAVRLAAIAARAIAELEEKDD